MRALPGLMFYGNCQDTSRPVVHRGHGAVGPSGNSKLLTDISHETSADLQGTRIAQYMKVGVSILKSLQAHLLCCVGGTLLVNQRSLKANTVPAKENPPRERDGLRRKDGEKESQKDKECERERERE